jgi:hypothetical protein
MRINHLGRTRGLVFEMHTFRRESHALKACATRRPMHVHSILTTPLKPPTWVLF